jgi:hypothetical protein|tara:strand:+ start:490 stop:1026 length:537 start_codon:yes stop_codon:yes gene_type:complete
MSTTLSKSVLSKYKNDIFVETGTLWGEAIEVAIECGFKKIYSMEIDPEKIKFNKKKFKKEIKEGTVEIIEGDTFKIFKDVISKIDSSATFWLDAHWDGDVLGEYKCPLPFELEALLSHPIKKHTLLIDDRRLFGVEGTTWGYTIDEDGIMESISDINKDYKISFENGCVPNDIIVAKV